MKKLISILFIILVVGMFTGCRAANNDTKQPPEVVTPGDKSPDNTNGEKDVDKNQEATQVGDFYLGQPEGEVDNLLGQAASIREIEEGFYYGEPYNIKEYKLDNGGYMQVIIGENTKKVLDFTLAIKDQKTKLGAKLGDTYEEIEEIYKDYKKVENVHQGGELKGWYYLNNDQIIIFDFGLKDESSVNIAIAPDSKVEGIRVARREYFD